ncbi:Tol-Pal system protein TolB [Rubrivivax sp. A210]|uniref:Tol-Pal system beta propeller repeat protein TolB n=1 Tax=Rubrivivax sp. A210 TaxID=2772301 RepID=UPI0019B5A213|nr:Tol-Pal system beta propeller repeat protein TolB [Rubrivivax sp. A210]CAD5372482.1 Tol-Pal system protein TolB [Rubrivivax sp. A210]
MHRPRRALLAALGAWGTGAAWPALAQFRVEISGVGATQVPIAIAAFRDEAKYPVPIAALVRADLERSGLFRNLAADEALDERSNVDLTQWRGRGADALVAGSLARLADGRFDVRYKLWDAVRNTQLLGQSKVVLAADLRLAAHRVADEIHEKLTGERGVYATRIAFVVRSGRRYELRVTDADGEGGQIALTSPEPVISPAWAPDGKRLAYVSFEMQKAVVWVQDLGTGERRVLANFRGSNSAPAWSPDGRQLAVTLSQDGLAQLYTISAGGGAPTRLTSSSGIDTEPVYAPDGRWIFFVSDRGGGPQVYRLPAGGGAVERVTFVGDYNISPAVSPDGKQLAFITRQNQAFRLMIQDLDSGTLTPLTDTNDDESPSFAPNGRLLVYATRLQGADVLMTTTLDGKIKTRLLTSGADMREPAWGPFGR